MAGGGQLPGDRIDALARGFDAALRAAELLLHEGMVLRVRSEAAELLIQARAELAKAQPASREPGA